jgi:ABC-type Fe3+ transport system permease subunit
LALVWQQLLSDHDLSSLVVRSLGIGLVVTAFDLALAWSIAAQAALRPVRGATVRRALAALPESIPPLAMAVGCMTIPWLLAGLADRLGPDPGRAGLSAWLRRLADGLDPVLSPGVALIATLVVIHLPMILRAAEAGLKQARPVLSEAAETLGAPRRRARRVLIGIWLGSAPGSALILALMSATTSVAPALVLASSPGGRTIGPAVLLLADEPGGGLVRAAALASLAIALNLVALALAARRRAGPIGDWYRGGPR